MIKYGQTRIAINEDLYKESTMTSRFKNRPPLPKLVHGRPTEWHWVVYHPKNLVLSDETDIGCFTSIHAQYGVEIEDEVQIGSHCSIYSMSNISANGELVTGKVTIKKGASVGSHSTVMPGVTIGEGAVVGAHSLVLTDIPAHCIAYGVPAKVVKQL